jgi:hypothetical protein
LLLLVILGALAVLGIAGALLFQARKIRARHVRFASAPLPQLDAEATKLIDAPRALYHGTHFADGAKLLVTAWREECVCDLWCTADALFVKREGEGALLEIPLRWISEAAMHRAYAPLAEKELPMLRLRWSRGGEQLETDLSLRGGMASLESLRREIHLRQGNIAEQLKQFMEPPK